MTRKELAAHHLDLVYLIVNRYLKSNPNRGAGYTPYYEELIDAGMDGLFQAAKSFDKKKKASFHKFAELCIIQRVRRKKEWIDTNILNHQTSTDSIEYISDENGLVTLDPLGEAERLYELENPTKPPRIKDLKEFEPKSDTQKEIYWRVLVNGESVLDVAKSMKQRAPIVRAQAHAIKKKLEKNPKLLAIINKKGGE